MPGMMDHMSAQEIERLCYAEGFPETARLMARLSDAEHERDALREEVERLTEDRDALARELSDLREALRDLAEET